MRNDHLPHSIRQLVNGLCPVPKSTEEVLKEHIRKLCSHLVSIAMDATDPWGRLSSLADIEKAWQQELPESHRDWRSAREAIGLPVSDLSESQNDGECFRCSGTGEGQFDGAVCFSCRGKGVL